MQTIVGDRLRPKEATRSAWRGDRRRASCDRRWTCSTRTWRTRCWAIGDQFSMADCAAAPALYYANLVMPFADTHKNAAAYLERLMQRPSFARAVEEAEPVSPHVPARVNSIRVRGVTHERIAKVRASPRHRARHHAHFRCAARAGVEGLDRAAAHGAMVGSELLHQSGLRLGCAAGRRLSHRDALSRRHRLSAEGRLSRSRAA